MTRKLKVAIIGAGASGLCAARYASESGHEVIVYEQTGEIGGTWVYTDRVGEDEYGLEVHTSMYQDLYTNLPKEMMGFTGFSLKSKSNRSYIASSEVLDNLHEFVDAFDLKRLIKFRHCVIRVRPVQHDRHEIIVKDLITDQMEKIIYDAVFVCNGHYNTPAMPNFPGMDKFKGVQEHSHNYRSAANYKDKDVLIVGSGPSGSDIIVAVSKFAKSVTVSHRINQQPVNLPPNVILKSEVSEITASGVIFEDGTERAVSNIIYCTGYKYSFPFLTVDSDIRLEDNFIYPLYRHCINVFQPTMYFIGLPFFCCILPMIDIQARFCLQFLNKKKSLPTTHAMVDSVNEFVENQRNNKIPPRKWFALGLEGQRSYFGQLAEEAGLEQIPNVFYDMYADSYKKRIGDPTNYRQEVYQILDDQTFEKSTETIDV